MSHPSSYSDIPRGTTPSDMSHSDLIPANQENVDTMARTPDYTDTSKEVVYQPWNLDTAKEATAHSHANQYTLVPQQGADGGNYHVAGGASAAAASLPVATSALRAKLSLMRSRAARGSPLTGFVL